ncbi:heavy metal translocating P-type ATPase [Roseivirga sp.]|uniref:heavy metal translocating P-type ATPase n=1 Tax=Roseivirga sp. TaxID=1964215 RepID=UPI003B515DFF
MSQILLKEETKCYHCGDDCYKGRITSNDKDFCCTGCKTVYEILSENELCDYYTLESNPGVTQKNKSALFDFLDNEEIVRSVLEFSDGKHERVTLAIPNIHCSSCIWLLEHLERMNPGVIDSKVDFSQRRLTVHYNREQISLRTLAELLDSIGYTPVFNLEKKEEADSVYQKFDKQLLIKMGIAGFCFGNVMLLSFPHYLGITELEYNYQTFFRWLNAVLALPVMFYSGWDYFVSAFKSLKQKYANIDVPIALGLSVLFIRSFYEVASDTGSGYFDSLVGLVFFLLIGKWFQNRTYQALSFDRDYKSYFPLAVLKLIGKDYKPIIVNDLDKGDEILIRNAELIPADSILIDDQAFIDYSFVTGEAEPVEKHKGQYIYAGGRIAGKQARFIIQKPVSQSYLTSLWNEEGYQGKEKGLKLIDKVSQYFTIAIVLIAVGAAIFWQLADASKVWLVFTSVLIIACPCALALSTPFTHGSILRVLGKHHLFLKNADVIEELQKIDTIIFDKTGTITDPNAKHIEFEGEPLTDAEASLVTAAVSSSTHPLSRYVKDYLMAVPDVYQIESFEEITGKGIVARVSGVEVKLGSAAFLGLPPESEVKSGAVYLKIGGEVRGVFRVSNTYRIGLQKVIAELSEDHQLQLLSGDNDQEKAALKEIFPAGTAMHFEQKPDDKRQWVQTLQKEGKHVMMFGDGLNDAGALKQSNVGIAITEDISAFSPACDAIMDANAFKKLGQLLALNTDGKRIVVASMVISLLYNLGGITFAIMGILTPLVAAILMPLSSISVVAFTTTMVRIRAKRKGL